MRLNLLKNPRKFRVGKNKFFIKDFGKINLNNDEMVSFNFSRNNDYDFTKKNWGFYVSQSINQRVKFNNFIIYLVKNSLSGRFYLFAVSIKKNKEFKKYLNQEKTKIIFKFSKKNLSAIEKFFIK
jgi:hypothetical protein